VPTGALAATVVELAEAPGPGPAGRLLLSCVDTPGFDFRDGRELALERQVSAVVKFVDGLYADTMDEEAKVVRESKGDQHVHLCASRFYRVRSASLK
jgi:septin family protein